MESGTAELVDSGEKRDGCGRKILPPVRRQELISAYEKSGLTQKAFARQEGVSYATFVAWLGRHRRHGGSPAGPLAFHELSLGAGSTGANLEVRLPDGVVVRGPTAAAVAELVRALR